MVRGPLNYLHHTEYPRGVLPEIEFRGQKREERPRSSQVGQHYAQQWPLEQLGSNPKYIKCEA